jgi:hypothetical protein
VQANLQVPKEICSGAALTNHIAVQVFPLGQITCPHNNAVALVREGTISTERSPLVGEVGANFCGERGVR